MVGEFHAFYIPSFDNSYLLSDLCFISNTSDTIHLTTYKSALYELYYINIMPTDLGFCSYCVTHANYAVFIFIRVSAMPVRTICITVVAYYQNVGSVESL